LTTLRQQTREHWCATVTPLQFELLNQQFARPGIVEGRHHALQRRRQGGTVRTGLERPQRNTAARTPRICGTSETMNRKLAISAQTARRPRAAEQAGHG